MRVCPFSVKDKLKIDPDSEIAMTTLRASLNCPLGVCRMTMPVRSKQCSHVQCFDAQFYVKMNEKYTDFCLKRTRFFSC